MRIAMLSYHTCPLATLGGKQTGGMNVYVKELTRQLGRMGVQVDVFTRSQDDHVPHVLHDLGYGNRIVHIPAGPEEPLPNIEAKNYIPEFARQIKKFSFEKGIQYDLIHAHYWMSGVAGLDLKKAWNIPLIQMFHTLGLMKNKIATSPSEMEGAYRSDGEKLVMEHADRIIVATPAEVEQMESLYHADTSRVEVIPPGVDISRFYPIAKDEAREFVGIGRDDRMVLFVGRIERLKGIDILLKAFATMKPLGLMPNCPHYLVVIGGEPDANSETMTAEMARLQNMVEELGIDEVVVFLGKRGQETLPYYYSAAEVVVMPSHYESFGMVALEAMACGTPVIASQVGGLQYLVKDGETGYMIPDGNPTILGEKLAQIICNDELRERLGVQAHQHAQEYSWQNITRQIIQTYNSLLD